MKCSRKHLWTVGAVILLGGVAVYAFRQGDVPVYTESSVTEPMELASPNGEPFAVPDDLPTTEAGWRGRLTAEQYYILREKGTEVPFTSPLNDETRPGTYYSADCGQPLFRSEQKFKSGTGWPSFSAPINAADLVLEEDRSFGLGVRTEVLTKCGGHLGHVFEDGPPPTGLRYCMNGDALIFVPDAAEVE